MKKTESHREARAAVCNIGYVAGVLELNSAELARIMGISKSSLYQRKTKPWTLRVGELEKLAEYAGKHGMTVSAAQMMVPFAPAAVETAEISA